jgi:anti-sigma B factor antagonist
MVDVSFSPDVNSFRVEEERPSPRTVVLAVYGEADLHSAPELRERLRMAMADGATGLVVDLSGVAFVDSTSLGVLLGAMKQLRDEDRELRLVVPQHDVRRIFELTLLDHVFALDASRADALEALSSRSS